MALQIPLPHTQSDLELALKKMILRRCQISDLTPEEIDSNAGLINGPGPLTLDSLDAVEIAVGLRDEFGVRVQDASSAKKIMKSISHLAEFILSEKDRGATK